MATKRSLKQGGYDPTAEINKRALEINQELDDIDQRLALLDKEESAPRELQLTPRPKEKITREREKLTKQRLTLSEEKTELWKKRPMSYDLWERDYNPNEPQPMPRDMWEYAQGGAEAGVGEGEMAGKEKPPEKAGKKGEYDVDIGVSPSGRIEAPGGISASQMAIMMPEMFGASPEALKRATTQPSPTPPGEKPPEGYQPIDYTIEGRRRFEQEVINQLGFNPITFDPNIDLEQAMTELPQLFDYVFQGQILWADRDKMSKKQADYWNDAVTKFRAGKWREAQSKQESAMRQYNYMMNRFDKEAALKEKALTEFRKAPTTKNLWDPEKKAKTVHEWDPDTRQWVNTGKLAEAPKEEKKGMPRDVKDAWGVVRALMAQYGGQDIGEPGTAPELSAKAQRVMQMLGQGQLDPRLKEFYESQLKLVLEHYGISTTTEMETPTGAPGVSGKIKYKFDKTGKRIE